MASLIPGFEYDIFISYRQKDNRHEGWVTEFVGHLKGELEATFKEDVSIYFDENPHDGLLETHDVDESLKEKLKCLVFIPIISRTYCDPRSFAWEHEFKAFIEQASADRFGLKVSLHNKNVATRILPVRIHELDINDTTLFEETLGGVLRGVEFIYKSSGVNRPLRADEDHPKDNINKTYYRDQLNKVANAIAEIIYSLKSGCTSTDNPALADYQKSGPTGRGKKWNKRSLSFPIPGKKLVILLLSIFSLAVIFLIYRYIYKPGSEKIFAFIPMKIPQDDSLLSVAGENFIETVYNKLGNIKGISPVSRFKMDQCANEEELNALFRNSKTDYLMAGSFRKEGDNTSLWVELITFGDNKRIWSNEYKWDEKMISAFSRDVVSAVVINLKKRITPDELKMIEKEPTKNTSALYNYISGNRISNDAMLKYLLGNKMLDSSSTISALVSYDQAIAFDSMFAEAYAGRAIARSWGVFLRQIDSSNIEKCLLDIKKSLSINENLTEAQSALGFYYYYCRYKPDSALFHFNRASVLDPGDYKPLFYMALVYRRMGEWDKSRQLMRKVILLKPKESIFLTNIGLTYTYLHEYDSALACHQAAIDALPTWNAPYVNMIETLILKNGNTTEAWPVLFTAERETGNSQIELRIKMLIYDKKYVEALNTILRSSISDYRIKGNKYLYLAQIYNLLNNNESAANYLDSSIVRFNIDMVADYNNYLLHGSLATAYAMKGDRENADSEVRIAMKLAKKNILDELDTKVIRAMIHFILGDTGNTFTLIDDLLKGPSLFSKKLFLLDPVWKPLHSRQEYITLIKNYPDKK